MADVPARPFPMNLVTRRGAIQALPPRQVGLAAKAPAHRFHHVTRVSENFDLTWLAQSFEPDSSRDDLGLLIRRASQIFADRTPESFVAQQCYSRGPARFLSVTETRAVAKN